VVSSFLIIIFIYDLKHYIIPDKIIYPAIGITFIYQLFGIWNFGQWDLFRISDLGFGILPSLFLLAIILISRGQWMGFGDFKLAILMGLFLGWPNILVALFSAFFIGAIIGTGLIVAGRKKLSSEVPFGPFLVTGTFLAMFFGDALTSWYLNLFLLK
jgi:prepilin signal peptidase PulO-like enzyme (type II secretory pathway)